MYGLSTVLLTVALLQTSATPPDLRCGSYCLYVSLKALDFPLASLSELESKLGQPSAAGYSMGQLAEAAQSCGAETLGVETNFDNLRRRPGPFACIALVDEHHFVNIAGIDDTYAHIIDPPRDYNLPLDTLRSQWDGKALLIAKEPLLAEEDLPRPASRWVGFLAGGFLLVASASLCLKWWRSRA
jgi:ABC-type bacteriocin/lantibiotic exporter with double-glycine peptidase domain